MWVRQRRVVVTGLGLVTPLGTGVRKAWANILAGKCGVKIIEDAEIEKLNLPSKVAATVPRGTQEGEFDPQSWVPRSIRSQSSPFIDYAVCAAEQAIQDARWSAEHGLTEENKERTGVAIGSGIGSIEDTYKGGHLLHTKGVRRVSPYVLPRLLVNMAAGQVSIQHGFRGPNHSVSTACATGAHSIGDAFRFIKNNDADVMVAGGSEGGVTPLSMALFTRVKALSTSYNDQPSQASRPFDRDRDGFVMGEGAGVVVLEEYEHALKRGAHIYAEVKGYGLSGDAHHITAPPDDGRGAVACMRNALREANMKATQIDAINAHATSTPKGDAIEARAIRKVFGNHAKNVSISSTKGAVGHMLGAAGAVESIFAILSVYNDIAPPTLNCESPDLVSKTDKREDGSEWDGPDSVDDGSDNVLDFTPLKARKRTVRAAMNNSFGFGGTNASLVFAKVDDDICGDFDDVE